jgi:hypothetical protein
MAASIGQALFHLHRSDCKAQGLTAHVFRRLLTHTCGTGVWKIQTQAREAHWLRSTWRQATRMQRTGDVRSESPAVCEVYGVCASGLATCLCCNSAWPTWRYCVDTLRCDAHSGGMAPFDTCCLYEHLLGSGDVHQPVLQVHGAAGRMARFMPAPVDALYGGGRTGWPLRLSCVCTKGTRCRSTVVRSGLTCRQSRIRTLKQSSES